MKCSYCKGLGQVNYHGHPDDVGGWGWETCEQCEGSGLKGYWFADVDDEMEGPYVWEPCLETEEGMVMHFEIWFETKEQCEDWIEQYVIGRALRRD